MKLLLPELQDLKYKSLPQRVRVISELWMQSEMYCPACGSEHLIKTPNNTKSADFYCDNCKEIYELKSMKGDTGKKILDGAYYAALERITSSANPNLFVLNYLDYNIINLTLVPKYFFTPDMLQMRRPLSQSARRAGYIGSFILYDKIPAQGKIHVIQDQNELAKSQVIENYKRAYNLKIKNLDARGWLIDILNCVNKIDNKIFSINNIYKFISELESKHPGNHNIRAKIRQQLQLLRDKNFIEFLGGGMYKKL